MLGGEMLCGNVGYVGIQSSSRGVQSLPDLAACRVPRLVVEAFVVQKIFAGRCRRWIRTGSEPARCLRLFRHILGPSRSPPAPCLVSARS